MLSEAKTKTKAGPLLTALKQLPPAELHKFKQRFAAWQQNQTHTLAAGTEQEAELLLRIRLNSGLPEKAQRRQRQLRRKSETETITPAELTELQGLTSRLEWMAVERLEALIELAGVRGSDVKTLMFELGL